MRLISLLVPFCFGAESPSSAEVRSHVISGQATFRPPAAQLIDMVVKDQQEDVKKLLVGSRRFLPIDINVHDYLGR